MPRLIKRYGSRKLYDTADSRYVSLDELAALVRGGEEVQVLDNRTGEDATAAVLAQILSEEGRRGTGLLSKGFLHDLVRVGERTLAGAARRGEQALRAGEEAASAAVGVALEGAEAGLKPLRQGASELWERSLEGLRPSGLGEMRAEVDRLRERLEALETALSTIAVEPPTGPADDEAAPTGAAEPEPTTHA